MFDYLWDISLIDVVDGDGEEATLGFSDGLDLLHRLGLVLYLQFKSEIIIAIIFYAQIMWSSR